MRTNSLQWMTLQLQLCPVSTHRVVRIVCVWHYSVGGYIARVTYYHIDTPGKDRHGYPLPCSETTTD